MGGSFTFYLLKLENTAHKLARDLGGSPDFSLVRISTLLRPPPLRGDPLPTARGPEAPRRRGALPGPWWGGARGGLGRGSRAGGALRRWMDCASVARRRAIRWDDVGPQPRRRGSCGAGGARIHVQPAAHAGHATPQVLPPGRGVSSQSHLAPRSSGQLRNLSTQQGPGRSMSGPWRASGDIGF